MAHAESINTTFTPGTVRLEDLHQPGTALILQPQPSRDPNDPLNWPTWRKHLNYSLVSLYVIVVFAMLNIATVSWGPMIEELGFSFDIINDSYAAGCGGLCIGGIFLIPFVLKYGRRPVYILSMLFELGIAVWSARIFNVADLMLTNILCCFVGSLCEIMMQMTIADVYFVHQRGVMNSIYVWTLAIGSSLAPLAAGYIAVDFGWRWIWWTTAIVLGVSTCLFIFLYEETMFDDVRTLRGVPENDETSALSAIDRDQDTKTAIDGTKQSEELGIRTNTDLARQQTIDETIPKKTYVQKLAFSATSSTPLWSYIRRSYRPVQILFRIPAVTYMAFVNGAVFTQAIVCISAYSTYMTLPPYNFTASQIGLMGLPSFIGTMASALICGPLSDWMIVRMSKRNGGVYEPEMRLWLMLAFTPFFAAGLLMFGIGLGRGLPWPIVAIGSGIASFGSTPASSISLTYLTDSYTDVSATRFLAVVGC